MLKNFTISMLMLIASASVFAQKDAKSLSQTKAMTNQDVLALVTAGLPESVVIEKIRTSKTSFDTSTEALVALKKEGVPSSVIRLMVNPDAKPEVATAQTESLERKGPVPTENTMTLSEAIPDSPVVILRTWGPSGLVRVEISSKIRPEKPFSIDFSNWSPRHRGLKKQRFSSRDADKDGDAFATTTDGRITLFSNGDLLFNTDYHSAAIHYDAGTVIDFRGELKTKSLAFAQTQKQQRSATPGTSLDAASPGLETEQGADLTAIPTALREDAERTFASGKTYFIWTEKRDIVVEPGNTGFEVPFAFIAKGRGMKFKVVISVDVSDKSERGLVYTCDDEHCRDDKGHLGLEYFGSSGSSWASFRSIINSRLEGRGLAYLYLVSKKDDRTVISNSVSVAVTFLALLQRR